MFLLILRGSVDPRVHVSVSRVFLIMYVNLQTVWDTGSSASQIPNVRASVSQATR